MRYQSVIGFGEVKIIMRHYTDKAISVEDASLLGVTLFKLKINKMMGKKSGY